MKAAPRIETDRLSLEKPAVGDAREIFERYASDPEVTHYLAWPTHTSVKDTLVFLDFSDAEWNRWPAGPYLIRDRENRRLLGSTGLAFEAPFRATTGYVLAKDAWGQGIATEALLAMRDLAAELGARRVYALCHPDNEPSLRVLEKGDFTREGVFRQFAEFPNLGDDCIADVVSYAWIAGERPHDE